MSGNLIISVVIDVTVYFMMRRKLLNRMNSWYVELPVIIMMKDELIVVEHQVDGTRFFIYSYIDVFFLPYLRHS